MVYVIGLTGGIGSGKTTVSDLFKKLGVPVIDADVIAHDITQKNALTYEKIITHVGPSILQKNGDINRQALRKLIFQDPVEKKWLEDLLHPLIRQAMREAIQKVKAPYCICVIPLLAESSGIDFLDRIVVVDTPLEMQLARATERDKTDDALIQKIIGSQASREARLKMADDVIENNSDFATIEKRVLALHHSLLNCKETR